MFGFTKEEVEFQKVPPELLQHVKSVESVVQNKHCNKCSDRTELVLLVLILSVPSCVHSSGLQWPYQSGAVLKYNTECHSWNMPELKTLIT